VTEAFHPWDEKRSQLPGSQRNFEFGDAKPVLVLRY
jgi:hypothetical protein